MKSGPHYGAAQGAPRPAELVDQQSRESGSIRVIVGPMFAGKTKELLRSIDDYKVVKLGLSPFCLCPTSHETLFLSS